MENCAICHTKLTSENTAKWYLPDTDKHGTIRTDALDRKWCQKCTDAHDNIDFD